MSIESEIRREGIEVINRLNTLKVNLIASNIAKKLVDRFPEQNFDYNELFSKISKINMYIARIPNGIAAKYFYKNSSIYFSETTDLVNLNDVIIHECIHALQANIDSKNRLVRLGLCDFTDSSLSGMGLNEAAVQLMTMRTTKSKFDTVKYFDIELPSNSPNYYTLECNLVRQMAYITGEYILYNSTLYGNDMFKNKFIALTSKDAFETIKHNINTIMFLEDQLNYTLDKIQNSDNVSLGLIKRSAKLKKSIKKVFLITQNRIFTSFFDNFYDTIYTPKSIETFRKALYSYREFIGVTDGYSFFTEYYINKMTELDDKCNNIIPNKQLALVPIKNTLTDRIIKKIKTIIGINNGYRYNYNDINMK